ncbi:MAG: hypothetical protein QM701_11310 [Propionivibrio sp.]
MAAPGSGQFDQQRFPFGLEFLRPLLKRFVEGQAVLDGGVQVALGQLGFFQQPGQFVDLRLLGRLAVLGVFPQFGDELVQPLGLADAVGELADDERVERVHRQIAAVAGVVALALPVRAFVVVIASALAGDGGKPVAAGASEQAGQQVRRGDNARRGLFRGTLFTQAGRLFEQLRGDDRVGPVGKPFVWRAFLAGA